MIEWKSLKCDASFFHILEHFWYEIISKNKNYMFIFLSLLFLNLPIHYVKDRRWGSQLLTFIATSELDVSVADISCAYVS